MELCFFFLRALPSASGLDLGFHRLQGTPSIMGWGGIEPDVFFFMWYIINDTGQGIAR